jgi:hypothetical protein
MATQKQRSDARKRRDKADFHACMEREYDICQRCGAIATQMHHGKRKHLHVRHDPQWHYALCYPCHDWAHRNVAAWDSWMADHPND